jgi:ATP-dependent Clp protease ATP-binding subunit ClpC
LNFCDKDLNNLVPFVLEGRSVVSLDLARIVAGSRYRGNLNYVSNVFYEVLAQPNIIILLMKFIILEWFSRRIIDAANILKPVLSRSGFQCI